jgi:hypothetical protein
MVDEYLRPAGMPIRGRGRPGEGPEKSTIPGKVSTDRGPTGPSRAPSASACEPYREPIDQALTHGPQCRSPSIRISLRIGGQPLYGDKAFVLSARAK